MFSKQYSVHIIATALITQHAKCWNEWKVRFAVSCSQMQLLPFPSVCNVSVYSEHENIMVIGGHNHFCVGY